MGKERYRGIAAEAVGLHDPDAIGAISNGKTNTWLGYFRICDNEVATETALEARKHFVMSVAQSARAEGIDIGSGHAGFVSYREYLEMIKEVPGFRKQRAEFAKLRAKLRPASDWVNKSGDIKTQLSMERDVPSMFGFNYRNMREKVDELSRQVGDHVDTTMTSFARNYDPDYFTPDRRGYLLYISFEHEALGNDVAGDCSCPCSK